MVTEWGGAVKTLSLTPELVHFFNYLTTLHFDNVFLLINSLSLTILFIFFRPQLPHLLLYQMGLPSTLLMRYGPSIALLISYSLGPLASSTSASFPEQTLTLPGAGVIELRGRFTHCFICCKNEDADSTYAVGLL